MEAIFSSSPSSYPTHSSSLPNVRSDQCHSSSSHQRIQPRQKERFLGEPKASALQLWLVTKKDIGASSRQGCRFRVRSLRAEEENGKFFTGVPPGSPPKYTPSVSDSSDWDLDDELDVPMVRRSMSEARRDGFSAAEDEFRYRRRMGMPVNEDKPREASPFTGVNKFIVAGIFVLGMGAGIAVDTTLNLEPSNVASREVIDRQTPNPDVCLANGMSAMVLDHRLFITFNPFNVYVSQAEVKPGCVIRQSNWFVLESRGLVSSDEVRDCKRNMNTFGFVGDLRQAPEISCVYHSESAENQFLKDPAKAALGDGFQPKDFNE